MLFDVSSTIGVTIALDGADLRNGDLVVGQDLQQERLEFLVRLVDLVDQQHRAAWLLQRAQQRTRLQELAREEDVAEGVQLVERGRQRVGYAPITSPILSFRIWV